MRDFRFCSDVGRSFIPLKEFLPRRGVMESREEVIEYSSRECRWLFERDIT